MNMFKTFSSLFKATGHDVSMSYTASQDKIDFYLLNQMSTLDFRCVLEILANKGVPISLINDTLATKKLITLGVDNAVRSWISHYKLETQTEKTQSRHP